MREVDRAGRPIEAITFDFSGTLASRPADAQVRRRGREAIKQWLKEQGAPSDTRSLRGIRSTAARIRAVSRPSGDAEGVAQAADFILRALRLRLSDAKRAELEELLRAEDREDRYGAAEGAGAALRALHSRSVRLGIVTNLGSSMPGFVLRCELETIGLARFFEPAAISCSDEVGVRKPDPRIFLTSLRAVGAAPDRAVHVGDRKLEDVHGARRLGMLTARYTGFRDDESEGADADIVVRRLEELPALLGL
jgi:HAD superfamily hydrolase (TIGR01549 family)